MTKPLLNEEQPTQIRRYVFAIACGTSWLLYFHRYMFALIKPRLAEQWDLGTHELGLLDGAFSLAYTAFQIPIGVATDFIGVHLILTVMIVVWSIALGMHAWAPNVKYMWFARAALGLGQSAAFAAQSRITRTWFPSAVRTTVQGWVGVFFGRFGGLSANLLIGSLLLGIFGFPWRTVAYVMMGVGIAHAFLFAMVFRNSPTNHPAVNEAEAALIADENSLTKPTGKQPRIGFRQMFRGMSPRAIVNLLALNIQTILSTVADNIFSAWIPLFLWQVHDLRFKEMGFYSALPLLGGALGGAVGGWLNDQMIRRTANRRWSRRLVGMTGKGIAGALLLISLFWYDSPQYFCGMLFFVKFFSDWSLTTTWGTVTDIGGNQSASVFAFNNSVAGIGSIAAPVMYGYIAEYEGWTNVFLTGAAVYLLCAASWLLIDCTIPVFADKTSGDSPPKTE
jgi:MFS family permease